MRKVQNAVRHYRGSKPQKALNEMRKKKPKEREQERVYQRLKAPCQGKTLKFSKPTKCKSKLKLEPELYTQISVKLK